MDTAILSARSYTPSPSPKAIHGRVKLLHAQFLSCEGISVKHETLRQLKGIINEFLTYAPHDCKFIFPETGNILSGSVASIDDFDPQDASEAFQAIAKYSHNLLDQPWRKEFFRLKVSSGYWMHKIRAHLEDAETLLSIIGYVESDLDENVLILSSLPDPEVLVAISLDCYVASQECLILSQIWERVQRKIPEYPLILYEAFLFRKANTGSVAEATQYLIGELSSRETLAELNESQIEDSPSTQQSKTVHLSNIVPDVKVERLIEIESADPGENSHRSATMLSIKNSYEGVEKGIMETSTFPSPASSIGFSPLSATLPYMKGKPQYKSPDQMYFRLGMKENDSVSFPHAYQEKKAPPSKKPCQNCTLLNDPTNIYCDACEEPFLSLT